MGGNKGDSGDGEPKEGDFAEGGGGIAEGGSGGSRPRDVGEVKCCMEGVPVLVHFDISLQTANPLPNFYGSNPDRTGDYYNNEDEDKNNKEEEVEEYYGYEAVVDGEDFNNEEL